MTEYCMNHLTPDEDALMLDAFDMSSNNHNNQNQTVPPISSLASTSTVHHHDEFNQVNLQQHLQGLLDTARESWTYAIFWQSSVLDQYSGPPILGWGDGYYRGDPNKPKTVISATSLAEQQHRKKVLSELNSMISGTQAQENDAVDEEVTDTEWFFLISMTQSFVNGVGLPGQARVTNQPVWVAGYERLRTSHCERARQGQVFGIQTIVCIPSADGVIELGSTELIYQSWDIIKDVSLKVLFEIKMSKVVNKWERLVRGVLRREHLRLTGKMLEQMTSIYLMLQGADEIQSEDAHVARILCEQAYSVSQSLDPNSEGREILQFKTGLTCVMKQKLAIKDGRIINRKCDAQHLWNFYQHYKKKHRVDEIQKEEQKMIESGTFSVDVGLRSQEINKVFTTLRALVEVMEVLIKEGPPGGVGREIAEELKRVKLKDVNKTDGKEVKLEDVGKQGKEEGSTSRPKEWQYLEISLEDIKQAAKNFQDCIGKGGYGLVYKGELYKSGKPIPVAIKRLNEKFGQGQKEFLTEIQLLSGKKHPNLISLVGYCEEDKEKILVYEYAQRGSLDQYLRRDNTTYTLTWHQRLKICAGVAHGLAHLHHHVEKHIRIIHRDIKSANILLDENWVAKISDFGLSKLSLAGLDRSSVISHPCGTMGYCEPEYIITGILTKESDVYSFGMVLFEVLCGRLCTIKDKDGILLSGLLAKEFYERKRLEEIIDPSLKEHFSSYSVNKFSEIAYRCLHYDRKQRPPMVLVAKELEDLLEMEV